MANIKNKISLPFKIIKSDVSGGFIDKIHNEFTSGIDLVNMHEDVVNNNFESNLQSPFTNQWIGGKSHRHVPLNDGTDTSTNRPEAWHLEFIKDIKGGQFDISEDFSSYANKELLLSNEVFEGDGTSEVRTRTIDVPDKKYFVLTNQSGTGRTLKIKDLGGEITSITYTFLVFTLNGIQYDFNGGAYQTGGDGLGLEDPDSGENLVLEYSDDGISWTIKKYIFFGSTTVSFPYYVEQPETIDFSVEKPRYIRFRQTFASEGTGDNYALTDISISYESSSQKGAIKFYSHAYRNSPPAYWTREEYSKRPLNIKNIKSSGSLLAGNFTQNYQVLQTSGRRISNNLLTDNFKAGGVLTTNFVSGANDYSLPLMNKVSGSRSVIVERFSAPGSKEESSRGSLDREGEEMSPNIPLPYRNIKIRQPFYRQLAQHNPQFGSGSTYALLPDTGTVDAVTIHKVNRNRLVRANREYFDNGFVTHAIPRTDIQYSWITASATTTAAELGGYQSFKNIESPGSYYNRNHAFQDISFIVGTHFGYFESYLLDENSLPILLDDGGFILIENEFTNLTLDNIYINSLIKDDKSIDINCRTFTTNLTDIVPTYAEITNSPYTFSTWVSIRGGQHPVARKLRKNNLISTKEECKNYTDPPVTFKYRPLEHDLQAFGQEDVKYNIKHTYANNLSSVANKDLIEDLYLETEDREQFHDELYSLYTELNGESPVTDFVSYKYKEIVWPKEENTSLAKTRKRNAYYLDVSGSSRDGYDRQLGTQRSFWRDEQQDRKRTPNNLGGYTSSMDYSSTLETGSLFLDQNQTYTLEDENSISYNVEYDNFFVPESSQNIGLHNSISLLEPVSQEVKVYQLQAEVVTGSGIGQISAIRRQGNRFEVAGEFDHNFIDSYGINKYKNDSIVYDVGAFYSNTYYKSFLTSKDSGDPSFTIKTDSDEVILNPKLRYVAFVGGTEINTGSVIQDNYFINEDTPIGLTSNLFTSSLSSSDTYFSTLDYGLKRTTEDDSGRKPFFDSYEDYIEDVRPLTKEYSTIPEFKISDHMEYYRNGNFRLENQKMFILDGQEEYQSAETETGQQNTQFYKSYLQSDLLKRHDKVKQENRENSQIKSIKIKVSGIKKLLPYNGFYPQERSVQLANLYGKYIDENLKGGLYSIQKQEDGQASVLLQHRGCTEVVAESELTPPAQRLPEEPTQPTNPECDEAAMNTFTYSIDGTDYIATINADGSITSQNAYSAIAV